jgi:hypothetical protein
MTLSKRWRRGLVVVGLLAAPLLTWSQTPPAAPAGNTPASPAAKPGPAGLPPAVQQALQMSEGPDKTKALNAAAKAWTQTDPVAAFTWALTLPQPVFYAIRGAFGTSADNAHIKAGADFLLQQKDDRVSGMLHGLMINWALKDPAAAEAWCTQVQTTRDFRFLCIFSVADGLCRKKAIDAAAWADTLTQPDDHAAAIDGTATIWCRGDLAATTAWIMQLKNPADVKRAAHSVAASWHLARVKTDPSLEVWLNPLPLSPADKAEVLKGPHPDSFHISKYHPAAATAPGQP